MKIFGIVLGVLLLAMLAVFTFVPQVHWVVRGLAGDERAYPHLAFYMADDNADTFWRMYAILDDEGLDQLEVLLERQRALALDGDARAIEYMARYVLSILNDLDLFGKWTVWLDASQLWRDANVYQITDNLARMGVQESIALMARFALEMDDMEQFDYWIQQIDISDLSYDSDYVPVLALLQERGRSSATRWLNEYANEWVLLEKSLRDSPILIK